MKLAAALVPFALLGLVAPIASVGCASGSGRRSAEPTTLPSASRPALPPTRVRTEQSREDPFEVDGRTEPLGTRGGPLERRQFPSNVEPIEVPEPRRDEPAPAGTRGNAEEVPGEEFPEDLQRGGPDPEPAEDEPEEAPLSGEGSGTGGFIPIEVPRGPGLDGSEP